MLERFDKPVELVAARFYVSIQCRVRFPFSGSNSLCISISHICHRRERLGGLDDNSTFRVELLNEVEGRGLE